jgi:hypothetical protein
VSTPFNGGITRCSSDIDHKDPVLLNNEANECSDRKTGSKTVVISLASNQNSGFGGTVVTIVLRHFDGALGCCRRRLVIRPTLVCPSGLVFELYSNFGGPAAWFIVLME